MSGSLNRAQLIGHLGGDPEIRRTQDGRPIATLSLATSETWRDKASGDKREKTEWHRIVVFNEGLCKVIEQYARKGDKIYVESQIVTRKWQDNSGQDRYSTEIVLQGFQSNLILLGSKGGGSGYKPGGAGPGDYGYDNDRAAGKSSSASGSGEFRRDLDDDIPF